MNNEELRRHLDSRESACTPRAPHGFGLVARVTAACWTGGAGDRTDRAAREWLRQWRPEKLGAQIPTCGCAQGRCAICN